MKSKFLLLSLLFLINIFVNAQDVDVINLHKKPQIVDLGGLLKWKECSNKYYLPLEIPQNAKGIIYSIKDLGKDVEDGQQKTLFMEVQDLAKKYSAAEITNYINFNESSTEFNLYILPGKENAESFFNCGHYKYIEKYIHTKARTGFVEKGSKETIYLGIENSKDLRRLKLQIEVVAVI
jgi:thioredoxin-related protein